MNYYKVKVKLALEETYEYEVEAKTEDSARKCISKYLDNMGNIDPFKAIECKILKKEIIKCSQI